MSSDWDEYAADWDSNTDVVLYSEKAFHSLSSIVSLEGLNILDFGCGTGLLTERMSKYADSVVGLDTSSEMLAVLRRKRLSNVNTIGDELSEKLLNNSALLHSKFDLVVASSVCGFVTDYIGTLLLLKSLLLPGGLFVQWDWLTMGEKSRMGLSEEKILDAFNKAGLEMVSISMPFSLSSTDGNMSVLMGVGKNA